MNIGRITVLIAASLLAFSLSAAEPPSDVMPAPRRAPAVELARKLIQPLAASRVPADVKNPFNPPELNAPLPEEARSNDGGTDTRSTESGAAAAEAYRPVGDRERLESIAARIQPTGTIVVRGKPLLTFSGRTPTVGIGQSFVVTYENQDHELEVVSIDRTTFTLRYRGEEITRPIKPTR